MTGGRGSYIPGVRTPPPAPERQTVLHSWTLQSQWDAPTVVGGHGAHFVTSDGREILDFASQSECSNLGHQHPKVVAAIKEQADKLCYIANAWGAEPRAELAALLLEKSGFIDGRVFFTLGGADANEHAVKFARQATGIPRRQLRGDGALRRHAHGAIRGSGGTWRGARRAPIRVSLPVRHDRG